LQSDIDCMQFVYNVITLFISCIYEFNLGQTKVYESAASHMPIQIQEVEQ